jgi:hypothetical protein
MWHAGHRASHLREPLPRSSHHADTDRVCTQTSGTVCYPSRCAVPDALWRNPYVLTRILPFCSPQQGSPWCHSLRNARASNQCRDPLHPYSHFLFRGSDSISRPTPLRPCSVSLVLEADIPLPEPATTHGSNGTPSTSFSTKLHAIRSTKSSLLSAYDCVDQTR